MGAPAPVPISDPPAHPRLPQQCAEGFSLRTSEPSSAPIPYPTSCLTLAHPGSHQGLLCRPVAQLPTHHAGCRQVPPLVTHGAPLPVAQHLHPALADVGACSQAHGEPLAWGTAPSAGAGGVSGCCPAPGAFLRGYGAVPGLTFPWEALRGGFLPLPLPCWKAGPGMQLTTACMPRGQACWRGAGGASCVGQRARWGSVPWHCTWCTQKLLFWLRFFRLPRERSGNRGISGGERLPCRCPLPRAGPYLELGSFSFMFHSFLQGAWMQVRGGSAPPPRAPALPSTPRQQLGLEGAPMARWGPLPSGNSCTGAVPQWDSTTPGTGRGSLWAVFIAPAQGSALLCLHPRCAGQGWGASWLLPSPALSPLKPPGRGHRHGEVPHTPSRERTPSLAPPFILLTTVPQLHVPGAPWHVPPARWHPAPWLIPFPTGRSWC